MEKRILSSWKRLKVYESKNILDSCCNETRTLTKITLKNIKISIKNTKYNKKCDSYFWKENNYIKKNNLNNKNILKNI